MLISTIDRKKNIESSAFYKSGLSIHYFALNSERSPDFAFESGVVKLQHGQQDDLTDAERSASSILKVTQDVDREESKGQPDDEELSIAEILARSKRCRIEKNHFYMNRRFVLGSVVEIERIWSISKHTLSDYRMGMTPILFEALLFLKVSRQYWDQLMFITAMSDARTQRVEHWIRADELQAEFSGIENNTMN